MQIALIAVPSAKIPPVARQAWDPRPPRPKAPSVRVHKPPPESPLKHSQTDLPLPLADCAIQVHGKDHVAVARRGLEAGQQINLPDNRTIQLTIDVPPGHRFALLELPTDTSVLQYGSPIGISTGIAEGECLTRESLRHEVPLVRAIPSDLSNPAPTPLSPQEAGTFQGFRRPNSTVGLRNFVLVVPTSMCASHEAREIATRAEYTLLDRERHPGIDGVISLPHGRGCGNNDGDPTEYLLRVLRNYAAHPNVGAVLFIGLGCEKTGLGAFETYLKRHGGLGWDKPSASFSIQEVGGTRPAIERGLREVEILLESIKGATREAVPLGELTLGVKCGGSDGFSGLSANPALGEAVDLLIRAGGTVLITEVPEFCGAEHLFASRAKNASVANDIHNAVDWYREHAASVGARLDENPSPGNIAGGLLNITIKALGAMAKSGSTRVEGVTDYAIPPTGKGLWLMQGPGYDQESTPGLVAAGAQAVIFTTGRGTTIGNAIAPVLKLASNTPVFEKMGEDLDLSAGGIIDGTETAPEVGLRILEHLRQTASGEVLARAEESGHREFGFWGGAAVSL
ncbi:MAG: galactonate dehydratase [Planctomycetes bacterium]|nr:galactonate dehydratase [Planctomycetota bacterium]